jgi:hypothetical protein
MICMVTKHEIESFRGKRAAVQILTLSCSYAELLEAHGKFGHLVVRVLSGNVPETIGHVALVHPISAPAMLTIRLAEPRIQVGAELELEAPNA